MHIFTLENTNVTKKYKSLRQHLTFILFDFFLSTDINNSWYANRTIFKNLAYATYCPLYISLKAL